MKPIIIISLPKSLTRVDEVLIRQQAEGLNKIEASFIILSRCSEKLEVFGFFEKDFDQVKFEKLKQFIAEKLESK